MVNKAFVENTSYSVFFPLFREAASLVCICVCMYCRCCSIVRQKLAVSTFLPPQPQNALVLLSVKSGKELLRKQFDSHATSKKVSLVKQVLSLDSSHIVCTVGTDVKVVTIPARYTKLD